MKSGAPEVAARTAPINPSDVATALRHWAIEKALPLWSSNGFDRVRGGFQERLHSDGSPDISAPRRLRVQARQIYVYAQSASLGWFADARQVMLDGVNFLIGNYRARDGNPGYVFSLAPDNSIADAQRKTYDHMFVLLALSWAAHVSGDAQIRAYLDDALSFVDEHLTAKDGSLLEGQTTRLPRQQNPHMHCLEAMLAMHETVQHPQAMSRARRLVDMMRTTFLDRETETLREYFTEDWMPLPGPDGDSVEPGHLAEWAWLLRRYERLSRTPPGELPTRLLTSALRWADNKTGLLIDEADRHGAVRKNSRRLWPQTELAKAWIAEAEAGRRDALQKAGDALRALADCYFDKTVAGGWIEQFDASGRPLRNDVPATSLYHLICAIAEVNRVLGPSEMAASSRPKPISP